MYLQSGIEPFLELFLRIHDSILVFINQEKLGLSILKKMSYNATIKSIETFGFEMNLEVQRRFRQESQGYN